MKTRFKSAAAFLALAVVASQINAQSAASASKSKGLRGFVCDDQGEPVPNAKVQVNLRPVAVPANDTANAQSFASSRLHF